MREKCACMWWWWLLMAHSSLPLASVSLRSHTHSPSHGKNNILSYWSICEVTSCDWLKFGHQCKYQQMLPFTVTSFAGSRLVNIQINTLWLAGFSARNSKIAPDLLRIYCCFISYNYQILLEIIVCDTHASSLLRGTWAPIEPYHGSEFHVRE